MLTEYIAVYMVYAYCTSVMELSSQTVNTINTMMVISKLTRCILWCYENNLVERIQLQLMCFEKKLLVSPLLSWALNGNWGFEINFVLL